MATSIVLTNPGDSVELISDGVNYKMVSGVGSLVSPAIVAPGNPASIVVSGFIDPISNAFTITDNITPPAI